MNNQDSSLTAATVKKIPTWMVVLIVVVIAVLFTVSIYITLQRYKLIGSAIKHGDAALGIGLAAPEIGAGIENAFGFGHQRV